MQNYECVIQYYTDQWLLIILFPGATVLVHGGSGKDTTLIVSSFAQVLLDPQCRTVLG